MPCLCVTMINQSMNKFCCCYCFIKRICYYVVMLWLYFCFVPWLLCIIIYSISIRWSLVILQANKNPHLLTLTHFTGFTLLRLCCTYLQIFLPKRDLLFTDDWLRTYSVNNLSLDISWYFYISSVYKKWKRFRVNFLYYRIFFNMFLETYW